MFLKHLSRLFPLVLALVIAACKQTAHGLRDSSRPASRGTVSSAEAAVAIAKAYAAETRLAIPTNANPAVARMTSAENAITASAHQNEYRERIRRTLEGKAYWMVLYPPETQLGGEYAFFIDENTGAVLSYYAGK